MEFTEIACETAGLDLTDFFETWNFYDQYVGKAKDYGEDVNLNQSLIDETKAHQGKRIPKPEHAIHYIMDNNIDFFKNNTPVTVGKATITPAKEVKVKGVNGATAYSGAGLLRLFSSSTSKEKAFGLPEKGRLRTLQAKSLRYLQQWHSYRSAHNCTNKRVQLTLFHQSFKLTEGCGACPCPLFWLIPIFLFTGSLAELAIATSANDAWATFLGSL